MTDHLHHSNPEPTPAEIADHAARVRAKKRAEAQAIGMDDAYISTLVETFYARIQADALLGPIFASRVENWPHHLERMKVFWRSILHSSGEYSGNPMRKHVVIEGLEERHFAHWLKLFFATLRDLETETGVAPEVRTQIAQRARMIADSLLTGIATHRNGIAGAKAGANLPHDQDFSA